MALAKDEFRGRIMNVASGRLDEQRCSHLAETSIFPRRTISCHTLLERHAFGPGPVPKDPRYFILPQLGNHSIILGPCMQSSSPAKASLLPPQLTDKLRTQYHSDKQHRLCVHTHYSGSGSCHFGTAQYQPSFLTLLHETSPCSNPTS